MPVEGLADLLKGLGSDFEGKQQAICDTLGSDDFDEIIEFVQERSHLEDLEEVVFSAPLVDKLFDALMLEKTRRYSVKEAVQHLEEKHTTSSSLQLKRTSTWEKLKRATTWEFMVSAKLTRLLEALSQVDSETAVFLVEALANADSDDWEAVLEPFLDPTPVLAILIDGQTSSKVFLQQVLEILSGLPEEVSPAGFFGGRKVHISDAQNRAISLRQLRILADFITNAADMSGFLPWRDSEPKSRACGQQLQTTQINLYHVADFIIKPATFADNCSFVELLAEGSQIPQYFVSHAWSEPVHNFIQAVGKHAEVRGASDAEHWWVCAYANNQHDLEADIDPDPKRTSFYLAMQQCEAVLLVLDKYATPFTRIWCCFEEAMVLQGEKTLLLDVATVADGRAELLTEGFVGEDFQHGEHHALEHKRARETGFPLELLELAYGIDITKAEAARRTDRNRILNTIAKAKSRALSLEPDLTNPIFHKVNCRLRGIFAEAAAQKAADVGRLEQLMEVLCHDVLRSDMTMNFGGCEDLTDLSPLSAISRMPSLQELTLNFDYCKQLSDLVPLSFGLHGCRSLLRLDLTFAWCVNLTDIGELAKGLSNLRNLEHLTLHFDFCSQLVSGLPALSNIFSGGCSPSADGACLMRLRTLSMSWRSCSAALLGKGSSLSFLETLKSLTSLRHLSLNFCYCKQLVSLQGLGAGLDGLDKLETFSAHFSKCVDLSDVSGLLVLVGRDFLQKLYVDLRDCTKLSLHLQRCFTRVVDLASCASAVGATNCALSRPPLGKSSGRRSKG